MLYLTQFCVQHLEHCFSFLFLTLHTVLQIKIYLKQSFLLTIQEAIQRGLHVAYTVSLLYMYMYIRQAEHTFVSPSIAIDTRMTRHFNKGYFDVGGDVM